MYAKSNQKFLEMFEKNTNHSSWYIQNEILNISSNIVKENIIQELKNCGMYALVRKVSSQNIYFYLKL